MHDWLFAHIGEDGSFYLQIARNLWHGHGVTFDGINPTTGVGWGWLWLLAPFSGNLYAACGLYFALPLLSAFLMWRILEFPGAWLWSLWLVSILALRGQWLMENNLVFALLGGFYFAEIRKRPAWGAVAILGLVLTRIDLLVFVLPWPRYWLFAISGAIVVCGLNFLVDGHLLSISGYIKAAGGFNDWPTIWLNLRLVGGYYFPWLEITFGISAIYAFILWGEMWIEPIDKLLLKGLAAAIGLTVLYIIRDKSMGGWYLAPLFFTSVLVAARALQGPTVMVAATVSGRRACHIIAACLVLGFFIRFHPRDNDWPYRAFVEPIQKTVPPNARIWMEDLSGKLAIATGRQFISGDGLVNSYNYWNIVRSGGISDYLHGSVDYVLSSNLHCPQRERYPWDRYAIDFGNEWALKFDLSYLTNLAVPASLLEFPTQNLVFDKCENGVRMMLFRVGQ